MELLTLEVPILTPLLEQVQAFWPWEAIAALLAISYLMLAIRQNVACWAAGMASTAIYFVLFLRASLYAMALLQLFYIVVAAYGWWHWSRPARPLPVTRWPLRRQLQALAGVVVLGLVHGALLAHFTSAALPYVDALISWAAVLATWMVARKYLENWLWWLVIDSASLWLYAQRGLWLTALLFAVYLVLVVRGWLSWRATMAVQPA